MNNYQLGMAQILRISCHMETAQKTTLTRLAIVVVVYLVFIFLAGRYGRAVIYPVNLFVTILHELGHALGGIISGGKVEYVQINADGSGKASILGGSAAIILMGGYLGSAIFGNLLFYIGLRAGKLARAALYILGGFMMLSGVIWFSHLFSTLTLFVFGALLMGLAHKQWIMREALMFFGLASLIYIIRDFNVGPSSDLAAYARIYKIIPASIWMYIWLGLVLLMTFFNIRLILKRL
jgi:hypothetical protein